MEWVDIWKFCHVLTFVYWVGADLGVFYSARIVANPGYSIDTRAAVLRILSQIDMIPRYMLVLTFPIGATLAAHLEVGPSGKVWLVVVWLLGIVWLIYVNQIHRQEGNSFGRRMAQIDLFLRLIFIASLILVTIWSVYGSGPFQTIWLNIKILLFAATVACGVGIRITFSPFVKAFSSLIRDGSSPEIEATMKRALNHAVPFVIGIWVIAAIIAYIGLSHERLFGS